MPAYNEENNISSSVIAVDSVLASLEMSYEIIVVNDGSKDRTYGVLEDLSKRNAHIQILSYSNNKGKGYAIRTGFLSATGEKVLFIDSDNDLNPNQIPIFLDALENVDLVLASKRLSQSTVIESPMRRFLSHSFSCLAYLLTGLSIKDTQTGLKAVKRSVFRPIFSKLVIDRFAWDVELILIALFYNIKMVELPIHISINDTSFFPFKEILIMLRDLIRITIELRLKKTYGVYRDECI